MQRTRGRFWSFSAYFLEFALTLVALAVAIPVTKCLGWVDEPSGWEVQVICTLLVGGLCPAVAGLCEYLAGSLWVSITRALG